MHKFTVILLTFFLIQVCNINFIMPQKLQVHDPKNISIILDLDIPRGCPMVSFVKKLLQKKTGMPIEQQILWSPAHGSFQDRDFINLSTRDRDLILLYKQSDLLKLSDDSSVLKSKYDTLPARMQKRFSHSFQMAMSEAKNRKELETPEVLAYEDPDSDGPPRFLTVYCIKRISNDFAATTFSEPIHKKRKISTQVFQ